MKLTQEEKDLIASIRLFRKARSNPAPGFEEYILKLFDKLMYEN